MAPKGGVSLQDLEQPPAAATKNYTLSKVGSYFLASELSHRVKEKGILSLTLNPGNLKTAILRGHPLMAMLVSPLLYQPMKGVYTELWAGLSEEIEM